MPSILDQIKSLFSTVLSVFQGVKYWSNETTVINLFGVGYILIWNGENKWKTIKVIFFFIPVGKEKFWIVLIYWMILYNTLLCSHTYIHVHTLKILIPFWVLPRNGPGSVKCVRHIFLCSSNSSPCDGPFLHLYRLGKELIPNSK